MIDSISLLIAHRFSKAQTQLWLQMNWYIHTDVVHLLFYAVAKITLQHVQAFILSEAGYLGESTVY